MPNIDDGRMYGILDEKFVTRFNDGSLRALTQKNVIEALPDGSFKIYIRDRSLPNGIGKLIFEKLGGAAK